MKTPPDDYLDLSDEITLVSNFDYEVDVGVRDRCLAEKIIAAHTAWDYFGKIWHDQGRWFCQVLRYGAARDVEENDDLDDLLRAVRLRFGGD